MHGMLERVGRCCAGIVAVLLLAGCYTSETSLLTADNSIRMAGVSEGRYCHAENKLVPPQVSVSPQISESLGDNKCRELGWDAERAVYVDALSPSMLFRVGELSGADLMLLQIQTGPAANARFAPLAAVDGMFVMIDPMGTWPEGVLEAHGLATDDQGVLLAAPPETVRDALAAAWAVLLEQMRADVAFVEDAAGPRLEFRRVDTAYSYIVYFREDWAGDTERMRGAMLALADRLGLGKHDATWTEHAAE